VPGTPQLSTPGLIGASRGGLQAALRRQPLPVLLLVVLCLVSFGARAAWIGAPCRAPCTTAADHLLIFDETYYVNAARVIAGIHPPHGAPYADAPLGVDPNAEHPPLVKLIIAGSIELFGDGPLAWRLGSLVMGTLAILGLFTLARAAGASRWIAFGAAGLMAADNLMIVHGRIGTLDIYTLAAMVWAAAAYLRGRTLLSGVLIGIGICMKFVAVDLLFVLVLYEALVWLRRRDGLAARAWRLGLTTVVGIGVFVGLLAALGHFAAPYDDAAHKLVTGGVFGEIAHIVSYAAAQTSPHGPMGIASYPWGWLVDYKPIVYLNINPSQPAPGLYDVHPQVHFLGLISPPILLLALPAMTLASIDAVRLPISHDVELTALAAAWFAGTFLPFLLLSLVLARTSYLYYMVIVMPGMYLATAWLLPRLWSRRRLMVAWIFAVALAAVIAYPLTPLP
jgi:predicted membrane-bound dolichyl-phosphate-mannose-protein mannosyltransferase